MSACVHNRMRRAKLSSNPAHADLDALLAMHGEVDLLRDLVGRINYEFFPALEGLERRIVIRAQVPRLDYILRSVGLRQILFSGGSCGAIAPLEVILDFGRFGGQHAPGKFQFYRA